MRTIALARVRLSGAAQNVCGISAQTFAVRGGAALEDQQVGWVDHLTLLDNCVLVERDGRPDELLALSNIAAMRPTDDLKRELLGADEAKQREAEAQERENERVALENRRAERDRQRAEQRKRSASPPAATLRDDDGDTLIPEAAITHKSLPTPALVEDEAPKRGRKKKN